MDERGWLDRFVRQGDGEAFAALVRQNADLVYSAARRQLGEAGAARDALAEEVTQAVFALLAAKAARVKGPLAGWLIRATCLACKEAKRLHARRTYHERRAMELRPETGGSAADATPWEQYAPVLDEALLELGSKDREAVTLRFLKGLGLREVGEAMGISEEAARKRVTRGLERLRGAMLRKTIVPGMGVLASTLAARSVEAAPAALVETIAATAAAKGAASGVLASATAKALWWGQVKVGVAVAIAAAVTLATGVTVYVAATGPAAPPVPMVPVVAAGPVVLEEDESKVEGEVQMVRWDVVLDAEAEDLLNSVATPATTASAFYKAMMGQGASLRRAVREARAAGWLAYGSRDMAFARKPADTFPLAFGFHVWFNGPRDQEGARVMVLGGASQENSLAQLDRLPGGGLATRLNITQLEIDIADPIGRWARNREAKSMVYDGTLSAGQAVAFVGKYLAASGRTYLHLVVWETFKADPRAMFDIARQSDAAWWCERGPATMRAWADAGRAWKARARHAAGDVPPPYALALEDGQLLRLVSLARPSSWPFCHWDARGEPVEGMTGIIPLEGEPAEGLWATLVASGTPELMRRRQPLNPPGGYHPDESHAARIDDDPTTLEVGVLVGEWKELARLKVGEPATVGGVQYLIDRPNQFSPTSFLVHFHQSGVLEHQDCLIAVGNDGKEVEGTRVTPIVVGRNREEQVRDDQPNFHGIPLADVKEYRLMQRRRQWVTFQNFARTPRVEPPIVATREMIAAAETQKKAHEAQLRAAERAQLRKRWEAIPPDHSGELNVMRLLGIAADKSDATAIRAAVFQPDQTAARQAQAFADFLIASAQLRKIAADRFGESLADRAHNGAPMLLREWGWSSLDARREPLDDGRVAISGFIFHKDPAGTRLLDLPAMANKTPEVEQWLAAITAQARDLRKALEADHHMTLDQLLERASQRVTPPPRRNPQ
jgi:RNA polymerase sigma factor (sigma-70 family)